MSVRPCRKYAGHAGACNPNAYVECSRMRRGRELCGKPAEGPEPVRALSLDVTEFKLPLIEKVESRLYEHDGVKPKPYERPKS